MARLGKGENPGLVPVKNGGNGGGVNKLTPEQTIKGLLERMAPEISRALPKHLNADRLLRVAMTCIRINPQLLTCTQQSLLAGVMQAAQLGLEPGILGQCYLLPFRNNKTGNTDVQFIIGYQGMLSLARRSGEIKTIYTHSVYSNDEFHYEYGLNPDIKHIPAEEDRGVFKGAYTVAHFKDGGYYFEYMPKIEIDKRKARSKAASSSYSPWTTDYEEMAKKTVLRHAFKYLPLSIEIQKDVQEKDETVKTSIEEEDMIEASYTVQEPETEEVPAVDPLMIDNSGDNEGWDISSSEQAELIKQ